MIQNVLRALGGIEIYGVLSVCLFFVVFVVALIFTVTRKKPFCEHMSAQPLNDGDQSNPFSSYEK